MAITSAAVAAALSRPVAGAPYGSLAVPVAGGLALAIGVASLGDISGAHLNPAVTLGLAVNRRFPWACAPGYIIAQFTQAVIHVTDVRAAVEQMRSRGVEFEEYDTPETRTEDGIARMPGGGEAAWFKDSEGNLVGVVPA